MLPKNNNDNFIIINNSNNNINLYNKNTISNFNPNSDLNQEYDDDEEEEEITESIKNLSINNNLSNFKDPNQNNNIINDNDFKNNSKINNNNSISDLFSSKSTQYSSIISFQLNINSEKIYENLYDKEKNILINSIIISNDEEIIKELYLKIIDEFYAGLSANNIDRKKNKICFLVFDSKKIDKFFTIFNENENLKNQKKVMILQGGKGKKMKNDYNKFIEYIQNVDIFISIPEVFYKLLSIGFIKINQFNILFFDDCHLCEGNHPYNLIMQEFYYYYFYRKNYLKINNDISLPKIIGFTDSPFFDKKIISNDKKCRQFLINISNNLDCQMIISPEKLDNNLNIIEYNEFNDNNLFIYIEVENHLKNKKNYEVLYQILEHYFIKKMLNLSLKNYLAQNKNISFDKDKFDKIGTNYLSFVKKKFFSSDYEEYIKIESNKKDLAFLSKGSYLFQIFEEIQKYLIIIMQNLDIQGIVNLFNKYLKIYQDYYNQKDNFENQKKEIQYFIGIIKDTINAFQHLIKENFIFNNDRLVKFSSFINDIYSKDKRAKTIIFTPSRKMAYALNEYLNRNNIYKYKSEFIAGVNIKKDENNLLLLYPKFTNNIINEANKKLNNGEINILICTPAVYDILQIAKCDYIMIFSELSNSNSDYIRIINLAINNKSKLIIFTIDKNKTKNILSNKIAEHDNNKIIKFFEHNQIVKDFRDKNYFEEKMKYIEKQKYYIIEDTQAKVTIKNSLSLFNEINNWFLQQNKKLIINKSIEELYINKIKKYQCKIELNEMFGKQKISSDICGDKQTSEAECILVIITFLKKIGILDNNLKIIDKFK